MKWLELKVPPVITLAVCAALIWHTAGFQMLLFSRPFAASLPMYFIGALGVVTALSGVLSFRRARTTVNPHLPDLASSLVTSGIYQYTRNPMYLGMVMVLVSVILYCGSLLSVVWLFAFAWYMTVFQIVPEERTMHDLFGEEYEEYCERVRRWI